MDEGHEYLKQLQDALRKFEEAVVEREKHKFFESKVTRRQTVSHAREKVVELVAKQVASAKLQHQ